MAVVVSNSLMNILGFSTVSCQITCDFHTRQKSQLITDLYIPHFFSMYMFIETL